MLPKAARIRLTRDFERVFSARRSLSGRFVRMAFVSEIGSQSRLGIITSTKVSKKATIRNKLRRRVRSIIAPALPLLKPYVDIVVMCQPAAATASFKDFENDVRSCLHRIFPNIV